MKHRHLKKFQLSKSSFVLFKFDFKNCKIYTIYYNLYFKIHIQALQF